MTSENNSLVEIDPANQNLHRDLSFSIANIAPEAHVKKDPVIIRGEGNFTIFGVSISSTSSFLRN